MDAMIEVVILRTSIAIRVMCCAHQSGYERGILAGIVPRRPPVALQDAADPRAVAVVAVLLGVAMPPRV